MVKPFSMGAVLTYRKRLKDQAVSSFQLAQRERNSAEEACIAKRNEYAALVDTLSKLEIEGITVDEHIRYQNRIEFVTAELIKHEETLKKKTETVLLRRKQLTKRRKEERALEKLKEKQNAEYLKFIDKKESAMLDEIALIHRGRHDSPEPDNLP
ncbi:MAG: flagellar export protein FliJ [Desulfocapsaceae bacterium]|jgi:flagellar export protein FliJ|nr:flagellar export protein FliJ [Desulfocapsaceae bacterium]